MKDEQRKKSWIIGLLSLACAVVLYILVTVPAQPTPKLRHLAQADSILLKELDAFSISKRHIRTRSITLDSHYTRIHYTVSVPKGLSRTYLHTELNRQLLPLGIETPATVTFPERTLNIHFRYNGTIFRTLTLIADSSLTKPMFPAQLLFYFDEDPKADIVSDVKRFSESKGIVLRTSDPAKASKWHDQVRKEIQPVFFWINSAEDGLLTDLESLHAKVLPFQKIQARPTLVIPEFHQAKGNNTTNRKKLAELGVSRIADGTTLILDPANGRYLFEEELAKFRSLAQQQKQPTLLIRAEKRSILWLDELLFEYKKSGLSLIQPEAKRFQ